MREEKCHNNAAQTDLFGRSRRNSKWLRLCVYLLFCLNITVPREILSIIYSLLLIPTCALLIFGFVDFIHYHMTFDPFKDELILDEYVEPLEWWDHVAIIIIGLYLLFYARIWLLGLCGW